MDDQAEGIAIAQAIARMRRAMPRNTDLLAICQAAEQYLQSKPSKLITPTEQGMKAAYNTYMREYMRQRRAADKLL